MKELAMDLLIVAFIGLITAGAKHLHEGKCNDHHGNAAYAGQSRSP